MMEKARIASHVSNRELDRQMNSFLDRLLDAIPETPQPEHSLAAFEMYSPKVLTDEEVVAALSTDATLQFANSKSCWEENNGTELVTDRRTGGERRRNVVSKAVGAGS